MFAVTGRRGRLFLILTGVAIVLALLALLVIHA
jgi:Na+-transporting methylmalonyl-CoA/oxaloacetate decarboxylase gamma subunit